MSISSIEHLSKGNPMSNVTITTETVTPAIALVWLESNTNNRVVRQARVNQYAADMAGGRWLFTGDPIRMSETGVLLDGQHRLWAIVESGVTLQLVVVRGLADEVFKVLDTGLGRLMADVLRHEGVQNAAHSAAAARVMIGYQRGWLLDSNRMQRISRDERLAWVLEHNDSVQWAVRISMRISFNVGKSSNAAWSVLALLIEEAAGRERAEEFLNALVTGASLNRDDPRLSLRNWSIARGARGLRVDVPVQLSTSIIAFNKWNKGRKAVNVKVWDRSAPFPVVEA